MPARWSSARSRAVRRRTVHNSTGCWRSRVRGNSSTSICVRLLSTRHWCSSWPVRCDVIKLNDDELGRLASYVRTGRVASGRASDGGGSDFASLRDGGGGGWCDLRMRDPWCARRGLCWKRGELTGAPAPRIVVRDTVGAGDAFMAGFMVGMIGGLETGKMLTAACELGGYVASFPGATPPLPPEIVAKFSSTNVIRA